MSDVNLNDLAAELVNLVAEKRGRGGAPEGGASILEDPSRMIAWARRTQATLGDPAFSVEDILQEAYVRVLQDEIKVDYQWVSSRLFRWLVSSDTYAVRDQDFSLAATQPINQRLQDLSTDLRLILTEDEYQAVMLCMEGLSVKEIAEEMIYSDKTAMKIIKRSRIKIFAYLSEYRNVA